MLRTLDLFSGLGAFSLGLERTGGFETQAFCEIDSFCRRVLNKHWPRTPIYEDVKTLSATRLAADGIACDVLCGGFPCVEVSNLGKRAGFAGAYSGPLWREYARLVRELRPRFIIVENPATLLIRGFDEVLGELASLGLSVRWECLPASSFGSAQERDRLFVIAHSGERPLGAGWLGGCRKSHEMIGRDWYTPEEAEAIMRFPIGYTELEP